MIITETKLIGLEKEFRELEKKVTALGFDRWTWDYAKLMYDLSLQADGNNYYLRIPGRVVNQKALERPKALIRLGQPIFARHFYPHGLDEQVAIPESLQTVVQEKIEALENALI